jgi:hypothetical protein
VALAMAGAVLVIGATAAFHYAAAGLATSHYDARAHLVVARRVFDSLTPGWQQIGAVWLPLPHMLNMLPVQVDAWYRSGASATAFSIMSMAAAAWALATLLLRTTGSASAALTGAALLMLNPNVLYLQSTPMTEPMLVGATLVGVALTAHWIQRGIHTSAVPPGLALVAACLTRYEAWPVTAGIVGLGVLVMLRTGIGVRDALRAGARLAAYPAVAVIVFTINSRYTTGAWFVTGGFFVPENVEALGHPLVAFAQVREGLYRLSGTVLVWSAYAGAALTTIAFATSRRRAPLLLLLALAAAAALPWYAYVNGHPFRIRYDVPLVAACAAMCAALVALLWRPLRPVAGALIVIGVAWQAPPLDRTAPLIVESQRDASHMEGRKTVTAYLSQHYDGATIMMSMGSLGHYMHDLGRAGFDIKDFLHEGNGDVWPFALLRPRDIAGWIVIEEYAEGGDALYQQAKRNVRFLEGFERVAEGGNVALYRARGGPSANR